MNRHFDDATVALVGGRIFWVTDSFKCTYSLNCVQLNKPTITIKPQCQSKKTWKADPLFLCVLSFTKQADGYLPKYLNWSQSDLLFCGKSEINAFIGQTNC